MTNFKLDKSGLIVTKDKLGRPKKAKELAKEWKNLNKLQQVALIYDTGKPATRVIIVGLAGVDLQGWRPVDGIEIGLNELKKHIASELLE